MGDDPSVNNELEVVGFTDGSLTSDTVSTTEWALSAGALYRFNDEINFFANASRGYFFPQIRSVPFNDQGKLASYDGEIIQQFEGGMKFQGDKFAATATLFYTDLDDRRNVDFVNDPITGDVVEEVSLQSTRAYGLEAGVEHFFNDFVTLGANITLRDHEFTKAEDNPEIDGNELRRQPETMANTFVRFNYNNFDALLLHNYHGDNYANDSNTVDLDDYHLVRLEAGYTFEFDAGQTMRISANAFNLFDEQGITEGSPRQGNAQSGEPAQFFVGRPILPRRWMLRVTYDF